MEPINELKTLLSLSGKHPSESYSAYFEKIAETLMNKCIIKKGNDKYEIVEIEFYLYASDHQDVITYPRDIAAGQWFFHPSGVDLTFASNKEHFGGILIRGIRNINTGELTLGPQRCVNLLWDKANAFDILKNEYPTIVEYSRGLNENFRQFPRWISVKEEKKAEKIIDWSNRVIKNNSTFVNDSNITEIVFKSPYRFIKFDLIDKTPKVWSGYSAKPK